MCRTIATIPAYLTPLLPDGSPRLLANVGCF